MYLTGVVIKKVIGNIEFIKFTLFGKICFQYYVILFLLLQVSVFSQTYKNSYNSTVIINSQGENTNNLELRSPNLSESVTFTFPENNGDFDEVLTTDGDGNLVWTSKNSSTLTNDLYFDIYDATGGQNFTNSTITIEFDTERQNPNSSIFTNSGSSFTINVTDKFFFAYRVGIDVNSGSNRSDNISVLEEYNGTSWNEVSGFRTFGYNRLASEGVSNSTAFGVVDVQAGRSYRVRVWRGSGSDNLTTIANGSSLFIMAVKNAGSGPVGLSGADGAVGEKGDKGDPGTASDYINVYDGVGNQVTINPGPETIPLNTTRNSSGTIFTLENNNLIIVTEDIFMLEYTTAMTQVGGNNRSTWNSWLEEDSGSGFSEIPGTRSAAYSRQNSDGQDNANGRAIIEVSSSSTFRIRAQRVSGVGQFQPLQNATSLVAYTLRGGEQGPAGASGTITIDNSSTITVNSGTFIEGEGSINEIAYFTSSTSSRTITSSANLFWNNANNHLGIGNSSPSYNLDIAQDIGIGNNSNSGTLSFTAVNGLDTYRVNFTTSASTSENINYVLPVEQGVESSALMNDGGGNLYWGSPASIASSIRFPIFYTGALDYDCELSDSYIVCDNTGTTIAVNLPPAIDASGKVYFIKKTSPNGAAHIVTVTPNGTDTIDGELNWELGKVFDAIMLISDGDETWHLMSKINN